MTVWCGEMRHPIAAFDLLAVLLFVGIGRSVHTGSLGLSGYASTAWPFVTGLLVGWIATTARRATGSSIVSGLVICLITVAIGMVLRVASGQGTAAAFILVALGFLGVTMLGWRVVLIALSRLRRDRPTSN